MSELQANDTGDIGTEPSQGRAAAALGIAQAFLARWRDRWTRNEREDLAQETAIQFWRQSPCLAGPGPLRGYVRTIARRCRYRGLMRHLRESGVSLDADDRVRESLASPRRAPRTIAVAGRRVALAVLRDQLGGAIAALPSLNRHLVRAYYEGFSVAELSAQYELSEDCVKKRIYRSRCRLKKMLESRAALCARLSDVTEGAELERIPNEGETR